MGGVEVPGWLKSLPLAPVYRPTETEFADPIEFISRIEEEAAGYGVCKVIPPIPRPSKKFVFHNLNRSLSKSPELGDDAGSEHPTRSPGEAVFTTRHQELGSRRTRLAVHKQVWQSGELYTVEQFEAKSRLFSRSQLGGAKCEKPILVEAAFWKAVEEKPFYVEYANDVPGSGFCAPKEDVWEGSAGWKLSNSPWNLQSIAKSPGSLTRFMPDEVPGVTSPMVYIGMLFSWFAWHVEDHELHSLNFLHAGAPKTWYAVPGSCAAKFEESVRVHGYGGHVDRLVSFSLLGEKTTLISPEVIAQSGIPCCRVVQNPGEFVVTFPRAYHVGFSHGFNCGEAANFATPRWLHVAKEAAVRRAITNHLPMLSHQQLLYMLAMSFVSRVAGARSSRRKEERETLVKKAFLDDLKSELRLVNALLVNDPESYVALWHPDWLPPQTLSPQKSTSVEPGDAVMVNGETPPDLDVDSGTLTCTACGILGYPFMGVMQPEEMSKSKSTDRELTADLRSEWDLFDRSLRPRTFCLEHALEVRQLLQGDGGAARLLLICHSDYLKIRARAAAACDQVDGGDCFEDGLLLRRADPAQMNLINVSIDEEGDDEKGDDWTSKMRLNLRNCVRLRKESPMSTERLRLDFGGAIFDDGPRPDASALKWSCRRTRTHLRSKEPQSPSKKRRGRPRKNSDEDLACSAEVGRPEEPENPASDATPADEIANQPLRCDSEDIEAERAAHEDTRRHEASPVAECIVPPLKQYERRRKEKMPGQLQAAENPHPPPQATGDDGLSIIGFIRGPCEGLRPRTKPRAAAPPPPRKQGRHGRGGSGATQCRCDIPGCGMGFETERELSLHRRNWCTVKGCGKKFGSHKYAVRHQCVHTEERPLKCPWKGCGMSFKWAWARTEHLRVHTGERPYRCTVPGCGLTFRFVSDFSRHRRRKGHYPP